MSQSRLWRRSTQRIAHLLAAFIYSPLRTVPEAVLAVQLLVFPSLALSGVLLWRGHRLRRSWLNR